MKWKAYDTPLNEKGPRNVFRGPSYPFRCSPTAHLRRRRASNAPAASAPRLVGSGMALYSMVPANVRPRKRVPPNAALRATLLNIRRSAFSHVVIGGDPAVPL